MENVFVVESIVGHDGVAVDLSLANGLSVVDAAVFVVAAADFDVVDVGVVL